MDRHVMWQAWTGVGLESCRIVSSVEGIYADSVVLGVTSGRAWTVRYTLRCDVDWRARELAVTNMTDGASVTLTGDGTGRWNGDDGTRRAALDGCLDVDLSCTPFTNTLPVRRLAMMPGWSEEITVVYVSVPGLEVSVARQRYTCLTWGPDGGRYRYDGVGTDFTSEISLDADALVVEYPKFARRVWSR